MTSDDPGSYNLPPGTVAELADRWRGVTKAFVRFVARRPDMHTDSESRLS